MQQVISRLQQDFEVTTQLRPECLSHCWRHLKRANTIASPNTILEYDVKRRHPYPQDEVLRCKRLR